MAFIFILNSQIPNPGATNNPYCMDYYKHRLMVGTGSASQTQMAQWSSSNNGIVSGSNYVSLAINDLNNVFFKKFSTIFFCNYDLLLIF